MRRLLQFGRIKKSELVLLLNKFCSFHSTKFKCCCFHDLDKFGDCVWFLIRLWGLLTFGCGVWDFKLHWAKSDIRLGFNSPSKCVQLLSQPRSHILCWFFWWVPVRLKKISGCHFNLFLKKMNSHFGLSWKIYVGQKLITQMTKKPTNTSAKLDKMPVRHIQGQSCCHLCTFFFLIKKNPVGATTK
jgi:hypothetical protein